MSNGLMLTFIPLWPHRPNYSSHYWDLRGGGGALLLCDTNQKIFLFPLIKVRSCDIPEPVFVAA